MSSTDVMSGRHFRLQEEFDAIFIAAKWPKEAAMFEDRAMLDGGTFYFSPAAVAIFGASLNRYGSIDCAAPPRDKAKFLSGYTDADSLLSASSNLSSAGK
jgi:hypothetical protein